MQQNCLSIVEDLTRVQITTPPCMKTPQQHVSDHIWERATRIHTISSWRRRGPIQAHQTCNKMIQEASQTQLLISASWPARIHTGMRSVPENRDNRRQRKKKVETADTVCTPTRRPGDLFLFLHTAAGTPHSDEAQHKQKHTQTHTETEGGSHNFHRRCDIRL